MKSRRVRRRAVSIAVAAALTGVAACSAGGSGGSGGTDRADARAVDRAGPVAALRSAAKSTSGADSARIRSTTTMGSLLSMTTRGSLAWDGGITGTVTITCTGGSTAELMRRLGTTSMQARYLPDAYYARMSDRFAAQTGGRHWIRYGYGDLAALPGGSGRLLKDQMRNTTPDKAVQMLLASGDVRKVGEEKADGQATVHYAGTVRVAHLAGRGSSLTASQLAGLKKQLTQAGVGTETVDIWVNDRGLLVKKTERADTATGTMTQTAHYSDYGVKADARRPPAGDTADFRTLLKRRGASGPTS
ncbi:LolA-like protein [Streptomyces shenzhenensis]|uniref:hypothetical protein n=1 Tax=Streptomyces shenzhenensis TaxID=943815 RepID=UPI0015F03D8B|nr:hypothetical protein [Streptomyces shenzhenensis]